MTFKLVYEGTIATCCLSVCLSIPSRRLPHDEAIHSYDSPLTSVSEKTREAHARHQVLPRSE